MDPNLPRVPQARHNTEGGHSVSDSCMVCHRDLTRPAVIKEQGLIIQPLKYSQGSSDKTTGGLGGGQLRAGKKGAPKGAAAPPRQRARVKVVSAGRPR